MENKRPNVIILLVDALRARNVSSYGYRLPTTPHIDSIAKDGILFENAFTTINATDPAVTSMMTGLYPINHGIRRHAEYVKQNSIKNFVEGQTMLQSILKKESYKTYGLDWLGRWHKKDFDFYLNSFDENKKNVFLKKLIKKIKKNKVVLNSMMKLYFSDKLHWLISKFKPYPDAKELTKKAVQVIKKEEDPFFMFVHFWDVHAPYNCSKKYKNMFFGEKKEKISMGNLLERFENEEVKDFYKALTVGSDDARDIIARYNGSIRYVDDMIGRIVEELKRKELYDDTILIITADHGESLVEHGILFDHHGLYDESLNIPLIVRYPKLGNNVKFSGMVQNIDIMPTILDLLGFDFDGLDGKSLKEVIKRKEGKKFVFAEENHLQEKVCVRSEDYKLILPASNDFSGCKRCGVIHGGVKELYDLKKDPWEKDNLFGKYPKVQKRLHELIDCFFFRKEKSKINDVLNHLDL